MFRRHIWLLTTAAAAAQKLEMLVALSRLPPTWKQSPNGRDAIEAEYTFTDFNTCWAFMNAVTPKIIEMDHHPEWSNCYQKVKVVLSTHTVNGVSTYDVELGNYFETMAGRFK